MSKYDLPIGMMGQPPEIVAKYRRLLKAGESSRIAEMLAVRRGPRLETATSDAADLKVSRAIKGAGLPLMQKYRDQARKAGISITDDSFFNPCMADSRQGADPAAWLNPGEGRDKYRRTVRERGGASESLGVEFGESGERMDKEQKRLEKVRAKKKMFTKMRRQLSEDLAGKKQKV